ncbi:hypothetical protein BCD48_40015 [Pseudofrankia sp. BMG5.36]|nr:hypothetical protein BCD48_40015 [Pseudofrankia sp. BMG5.36]
MGGPFEPLQYPTTAVVHRLGGDAGDEFLIEQPTLAVPSWVRGKGARLAAHERLLLSCRPGGPAALLAAAVPATFLSSRVSERTRDRIARLWRPVLVAYFTGWDPTSPHLEWVGGAVLRTARWKYASGHSLPGAREG